MPYDYNADSAHHVYPSQSSSFGDDGDYTPGERALWRAVITQALMDISSNSRKMIDKIERSRALAWFSMRNPDFISVCALADLDPKYVLKKVKEALGRNCKWRKEPNADKTLQPKEKKKRKLGIPCTKTSTGRETNKRVNQMNKTQVLQFA